MSKLCLMDRIRELREQWKQANAVDSGYVSDTTVEQRVAQLVEMYRLFKPHIRETEELFGPERRQAMMELQAKLSKLTWTPS